MILQLQKLSRIPVRLLLLPLAATGLAMGCGPEAESPASVSLHYLGHSSFILGFDGTLRVLTDYGESNAYGLDSPIHGLGEVVPELVTLSHLHADHAGGALPPGLEAVVLSGPEILETGVGDLRPREVFQGRGLHVTAIPTHEGSPTGDPDNVSFLFDYRGLKILHLGDCQGLMAALAGGTANKEEPSAGGTAFEGGRVPDDREGGGGKGPGGSGPGDVRRLIQSLYPDHYHLVMLPIGFVEDILDEAAEFVSLLHADVVVPMHFWSPGDRDRFLTLMDGRIGPSGRRYESILLSSPSLRTTIEAGSPEKVPVIGLTPAPGKE